MILNSSRPLYLQTLSNRMAFLQPSHKCDGIFATISQMRQIFLIPRMKTFYKPRDDKSGSAGDVFKHPCTFESPCRLLSHLLVLVLSFSYQYYCLVGLLLTTSFDRDNLN
jgi:hypothetical protein